ncbi:hypothetical protein F5890DRAFT_1551799 [Lentinula detonsa]|uniref:Uncharacterized protein n=1 Tax=Lentinula detonsa TaxID=2804962 RepID=A0AA38Q3J2_9AGAR|nr:hypothetical protein F5890DRAFT_1551799 [Lentinula detonsa]
MSNLFIVDDQDASIKYTGKWSLAGQQVDFGQTTSSGSSGATLSFSFSGHLIAAVGDLYAGGVCNATFAIDGTSTSFSTPAINNNRYQQTLWTSPSLDDGNHTLVYTIPSCNNSDSAPWIDYLLYNSSSSSVTGGTTFFDDRDSRIAYTGTWNSTSGDDDFRGTITSIAQGGSFLFDFEGTSVQVFGRVDNTSIGEITDSSFSVDSAPSVSFTAVTSSNVVHNKQFYASRTLDPGQHRLIVQNTGIIPLWVDYILVRGQTDLGDTPLSSKSSHSGGHDISIIVGSTVGGVCGILLLIGITILLYRHRYKILLIQNKRQENKVHQHDSSSPVRAVGIDLDSEVVVPHHPQFRAHHPSSSFSKPGSVFELERRSLTRRQLPLPPQDINDTTVSEFEVSELVYDEMYHVERRLHDQLSHEGSYISLPNPYSTRHSHRSYSQSSATHSVNPSHTVHSTSCAYTDVTPPFTNAMSDNFSSNGYGFSFIPTHHIPPSLAHDDNLSDADTKQRQGQFFVLSVDGMTASPLVHTDSGLRLHNSRNDVDPELQPELPPVYTVE